MILNIRNSLNISRKIKMDELDLIESIMKKGDSYVVTTDDGSRILGKHETKKDAVKQLSAIEISMKKKIAEGAAADKIETQETWKKTTKRTTDCSVWFLYIKGHNRCDESIPWWW